VVDRGVESVRTLRALVARFTIGRIVLALAMATGCAVVFGTRVFTNVESVRIKLPDLPASPAAGVVRLRVASDRTRALPSPFAVIANIRNRSAAEQRFSISVDNVRLCESSVAGGRVRRVDCAQSTAASNTYADRHEVVVSAPDSDWTLEYLEVASYHGRSSGILTAFVLPATSDRYDLPAARWTPVVWLLLAVWFAVPVRRSSSRLERALYSTLVGLTAAMFAIVFMAPFVSSYRIVISPETFFGWVATIGVARVWLLLGPDGRAALATAAVDRVKHTRTRLRTLIPPRRLPIIQTAAIGAAVGWVFFCYASDIVKRHDHKLSSLLLISRHFFDGNPLARDRQDIRDGLLLNEHGYDGQYFYNMTYDPFLTAFRHDPKTYNEFIDAPPYRYGRIGFSVLTKILSANNPRWYPYVMVTLVLAGLIGCGVLMSALALRHGATVWYGVLVILIPGYWRCVDATVPEPIAAALFLGGLLLLMRQSWVTAGALFGLSMLVRETAGVFVVALVIGMFLTGRRRESAQVACLALAPLALWRLYVGWVFMPAYGWEAFTFRPDDFDPPLAGVRQLWATVAHGSYFPGYAEMTRAAVSFPPLVMTGVILMVVIAIKQPRPIAFAGLVYAAMAISMNYRAVWLHIGNAERVTIDLFFSLALVSASIPRESRGLVRTLTAFWCATALYIFFGTYNANETLRALVPWW
jgi:hypothetical protein